jgi:hypothetical protein
MIIISNICILMLVTSFLAVVSIRLVYFIFKVDIDTTNTLIVLLFILLMSAIMPRLCIWLF